MAARKKIDYERLEPGWRLGIKSPRQLAEEYTAATEVKVSHAAIVNHFNKLGIPRDLAGKVKAKADAIVTRSMVTGKVTPEPLKGEADLIIGAAVVQADIRLSQRKDITRSKSLVMMLLEELEEQTVGRELFEELGALLRSDDEKGMDRLNDIYRKVISLPGRIDGMKKLSDAIKTMVTLEREAYGIKAENPDDPPAGKSGAQCLTLPDYIMAMIPVQPA